MVVAVMLLAGAVIAACGVAPARAGALTVMPVRIEVPSTRRFCALTLGNRADRPVTVQVRGYGWTRDTQGNDTLTPDPAFVINPPIATIAPQTERLIRCSLPAAHPGAAPEQQWRLIVDELPDPTLARPGVVQTLLRISVPVFRADEKAAPRLTAAITATGVRLSNVGTRYVRVLSVSTPAQDTPTLSDRAFYLLAGGTLDLPVERTLLAASAVHVKTEEGAFDVPLSAAK
ncbi:fimbrial biogenesis chaperone [Novosphingobium sp. Leaf2]|uniref:fimbrial biogenesis chaperone n=1 Tax=Novosphingobium sp. Leaf2 TaxID=1735670 RepID=UPI000B27CCFC|nr:fimbria/pilus periplasmic chaperone [Novosphingobium sp. Leaf2]